MPAKKLPAEPAKLEIKVPALLAGAATSVVVAVLASRLGVQGTLIGAAFTSLAFGLVSPFLTFGLQRSHEGIRLVTARRDPAADEELVVVDADAGGVPDPGISRPSWRRIPLATALAGVAVTALITFVATLGVLTAFETAAGRGVDGGQGTTVARATRPAPAPAPTTPGVDAAVLAAQRSASPSAAPSASASPAPTPDAAASATPSPTASPAVTASPTAAPTSVPENPTPAPTATP